MSFLANHKKCQFYQNNIYFLDSIVFFQKNEIKIEKIRNIEN